MKKAWRVSMLSSVNSIVVYCCIFLSVAVWGVILQLWGCLLLFGELSCDFGG
jgi:hypothetical protein